MKIYPAIDIMNGESVRLVEGKRKTKKVYGDPVAIARRFEKYVDIVHVVDLDGAFEGGPRNLSKVKEILDRTELKVQFGGGIRTLGHLQSVKEIGVENPIIGTKALEQDFIERAADEVSGLTVSLDIRSGTLAVEGWEKSTDLNYREVFRELSHYVDRFILTSVQSDGKLEGIESLEKFWTDQQVIYAGGVTSEDDLTLLEKRGFDGAIIGKAIYEEVLDLERITKSFGDINAR